MRKKKKRSQCKKFNYTIIKSHRQKETRTRRIYHSEKVIENSMAIQKILLVVSGSTVTANGVQWIVDVNVILLIYLFFSKPVQRHTNTELKWTRYFSGGLRTFRYFIGGFTIAKLQSFIHFISGVCSAIGYHVIAELQRFAYLNHVYVTVTL